MKFESLYHDRCYVKGGQHLPHFWTPQPIKRENFTLFGDDRKVVKPEWGIEEAVYKILSLNLELELPVGEYVLAATKKELPDNPFVLPLLKSNIADEARHYQGFDYAARVYPEVYQYTEKVKELKKLYDLETEKEHPLFTPMVLEVGLFLVSLGFLRVLGGKSLATLAALVSEDEYRHVATNRKVLIEAGLDAYNAPKSLLALLQETIEWLFKGVNIPRKVLGNVWDTNYLLKVSEGLLHTGIADDFDDTVYLADYNLPFERKNIDMYSRA